ncbi:hypothetical protein [Streptomyces deccanensis]|uniref:hypothetical protein n=1 Tax=Streptomyces deccanensis TaxID=424188 RepID=UPI001EFB1CB4|nr:hypothetical protein [Streptomyces deccanensis]ULR48152.1 hypothetical protein L3078_02015 [Streptomyces deccanensis]
MTFAETADRRRIGAVAALEALLAPDAVSLSDGNGLRGDTELRFVEANGCAGVLARC